MKRTLLKLMMTCAFALALSAHGPTIPPCPDEDSPTCSWEGQKQPPPPPPPPGPGCQVAPQLC